MKKSFVCFIILISVFLFCGCEVGSRYKNKLPGSWYTEGSSSLSFVLYDDGTCEIAGEYGEGSWSVVNKDELKLTNYYGETETATIKSLDGDKLILTDGNRESVFYSHPQKQKDEYTDEKGKKQGSDYYDDSNKGTIRDENTAGDNVSVEAYANAYADFLKKKEKEDNIKYQLLYIDDDEVPELYIVTWDNDYSHVFNSFYTYKNGDVINIFGDHMTLGGDCYFAPNINMLLIHDIDHGNDDMDYYDFYRIDEDGRAESGKKFITLDEHAPESEPKYYIEYGKNLTERKEVKDDVFIDELINVTQRENFVKVGIETGIDLTDENNSLMKKNIKDSFGQQGSSFDFSWWFDRKREYGDHKYELVFSHKKWKEASDYCKKKGGYLVSIGSREEDIFLYDWLGSIPSLEDENFWIGLRKVNNEWGWESDDSFSVNSNFESFHEAPEEGNLFFYLGDDLVARDWIQSMDGQNLFYFIVEYEEKNRYGDSNEGLQLDKYPEINNLMKKYFEALAEGDYNKMQSICDPIDEESKIRIKERGKFIEKFEDLRCYTMAGIEKDSAVVFCCYKNRLKGTDTLAPGMTSFYICTNNNELFVKRNITQEEIDYAKKLAEQDEVKELINRINEEYDYALESDPKLEEVMNNMENSIDKAVSAYNMK